MKKRKINYKVIVAFILVIILSSTVTYAATVLGASSVSYNNSSSKLSSTTVQGAIDEIYNNAKGGNITYHNSNIVGAYLYDPDKCTTGDEVTCRKTACPNNTSESTCPAGTIIKYKVNESDIKTFHVLHDDISTLTLQQNENTVVDLQWYSGEDNTKGPLIALEALERATEGWSNVNTINYTMGSTVFSGTNAYTGCSLNEYNWNCTTNTYALGARSSKARMITGQEVSMTGCTAESLSCPRWMRAGNSFYWTMSADSSNSKYALLVGEMSGNFGNNRTTSIRGARAVVVISK